MPLTAKAVLHHRQREDGTFRVRIRLTKDRAVAFLDAGFTVAETHWNAAPTMGVSKPEWLRKTSPNAASRNDTLRHLLLDADETGRAHPLLPVADLRDLLATGHGTPRVVRPTKVRPDGAPSEFVAFAHWYVAQRARVDKPGTVKFYANAARGLTRWRNGVPLPFADLLPHHLTDLHGWLLAQPAIFAGTARDYLVKLATVSRRAEKLGLLPTGRNPFHRLDLPKLSNKNPPARPTEVARLAVLGLDLATVPAGPFVHKNFRRDLATRRDIWHLQYLARGSRCGDILQLRERDVRDERISFVEAKTGKHKSIARSEAINAVLAAYPPTGDPLAFVFPALDHRAPYAVPNPSHAQQELLTVELATRIHWLNAGLRILADAVGVPPFTSHSARHMYTERAYAVTKDLRLVQAMLNHSDVATTERYLQTLGYDALDAATELVLAPERPGTTAEQHPTNSSLVGDAGRA